MVIDVMALPPEVAANTPVDELELRFTVTAAPGSGLLKASSTWTVTLPRVGVGVATLDIAAVVIASFAWTAVETV
jgi:hypothetical protein